MILDHVILTWCRENHDTSRESEFLDYAKYVALRPWIRGLTFHAIFLWLLFALFAAVVFPALPTVTPAIILPVFVKLMAFNGACTLAFIPYGFKRYHLGDGTTPFFYVLMVLAIYFLLGQLPEGGQDAFSVIMMPVSLAMHHVLPFLLNKNGRAMRSFHAQQELAAEDAQAMLDKAEFHSWVNRQQGGGFQDTAELPEGTNESYWAIQNAADLIGRIEAMHQDADCMELIPEDDRGMLEEIDIPDEPGNFVELPAEEHDPVEDFYKKRHDDE